MDFLFQLAGAGVGIFFIFAFWILPITISLAVEGGYVAFAFATFLIFIIIYIIACWFWAQLAYKNWKYELTQDAFKKESGVIWKKYVSVPYERIQNIDINRGVLARILGLSDLQIQTAGSSAMYSRRGFGGMEAEGNLPGLDKVVAEKLRDELIKRSKESKQSL